MTPEQIRWLWPGYLARGKFHIIAGAPSTGKTTVALSFAATISAGQSWPDGTRAETGNVLIWSGEDDVRDTLLPRLLAMGADPRRIYFIGSVMADGNKRPFDPSRDMDALARQAACIDDVRLLIVDPIVNAVAGDSHKNSETRRSLQPVVDLATRLGAAALGVSHFSKGTSGRDPIERVTGSLAFSALPRLVFATARKTDEEGRIERLLVRAKSNIGPDGGGYGYDLQQQAVPGSLLLTASYVRWGQALQGEARELLATAESEQDSEEHGAMAEAVDWLRELLAEEGGKIDRRDVMRAALAMGYKERTVHRARRALNLSVVLSGFGKDKRSVWSSVDSPNRANPVQPCQPRSAARMDDPGAYGDGTGATSAEGEL